MEEIIQEEKTGSDEKEPRLDQEFGTWKMWLKGESQEILGAKFLPIGEYSQAVGKEVVCLGLDSDSRLLTGAF